MKSLLNGKTEWHYNSDEEDPATEYAKIPLELISRNDISCKAKSMFAYMTSKPKSYQFASKRIQEHFKEGYRSVLSAINELQSAGYIEKRRLCDGRMIYVIKENWWSLTVTEAKELLMESFEDAFKPAVLEYELVTFNEAREAILDKLQGDIPRSYDLASQYGESCLQAAMPMNTNTLSLWMNHVRP